MKILEEFNNLTVKCQIIVIWMIIFFILAVIFGLFQHIVGAIISFLTAVIGCIIINATKFRFKDNRREE